MTRTSTTLRFALLLTVANGFLDAYTYLARGGVFANVQTGNVIFFALHLSQGRPANALAHVWPILAFVAGVGLASHLKSGRVERYLKHPLRWTMLAQAIVLATIGFVPGTVPNSYVTVPISFVAAMQIGLFRKIGDFVYLPVATTGNLMRLIESGYTGFVDHDAIARRAFRTYAAVTLFFTGGALAGAFATRAWSVQAIWLPAAVLFVTLVLFVVDERKGIEP
ncbi:YoaK family protein [Mycobacterium sp. CVI_P3]|uniref:YoaK family protein n=1 Tax=Mycobacterium pinniadriaticum TaxID=2994102 RepID=A0ABT3S939_9MYCO|nr:YoaK family protein [Mycobacterium pinniadriaticum]MCX2929595.1 YoaK family protein [Mycobacterium pinniadriaticum]MCX2936019.1 YoaK family protein [Mycobacterium pinniadriaticum]